MSINWSLSNQRSWFSKKNPSFKIKWINFIELSKFDFVFILFKKLEHYFNSYFLWNEQKKKWIFFGSNWCVGLSWAHFMKEKCWNLQYFSFRKHFRKILTKLLFFNFMMEIDAKWKYHEHLAVLWHQRSEIRLKAQKIWLENVQNVLAIEFFSSD